MFEVATQVPLVPTRTTPPRCAIYGRSATADHEAVVDQERVCEAWLSHHLGADVAASARRYVDVGVSGLDLERPSLRRLLADIEAGMFDIVIVGRVDRVSRSPRDLAFVLGHLANARTALISVKEGVILAPSLDAVETDDA